MRFVTLFCREDMLFDESGNLFAVLLTDKFTYI